MPISKSIASVVAGAPGARSGFQAITNAAELIAGGCGGGGGVGAGTGGHRASHGQNSRVHSRRLVWLSLSSLAPRSMSPTFASSFSSPSRSPSLYFSSSSSHSFYIRSSSSSSSSSMVLRSEPLSESESQSPISKQVTQLSFQRTSSSSLSPFSSSQHPPPSASPSYRRRSRPSPPSALERKICRTSWAIGDVYSPRDLFPSQAKRWQKNRLPDRDVFEVAGWNPVKEYKNIGLLSSFVTETGRIKPAHETGLSRYSQRKLSKAIRRANALGLMPSVHLHPQLLILHDRNWRPI